MFFLFVCLMVSYLGWMWRVTALLAASFSALLLPSPYFGPNSLLILLVFGTEYLGVYYCLLHCEIL